MDFPNDTIVRCDWCDQQIDTLREDVYEPDFATFDEVGAGTYCSVDCAYEAHDDMNSKYEGEEATPFDLERSQ